MQKSDRLFDGGIETLNMVCLVTNFDLNDHTEYYLVDLDEYQRRWRGSCGHQYPVAGQGA